jgi:hypothetical protein
MVHISDESIQKVADAVCDKMCDRLGAAFERFATVALIGSIGALLLFDYRYRKARGFPYGGSIFT